MPSISLPVAATIATTAMSAGSALAGGGGGGGGGAAQQPSGSTVSTQTSAPWEGQIPYLNQQYAAAQNLYNRGPYTGMTYAPANGTQIYALTEMGNSALNQDGFARGLSNTSRDFINSRLSPDFLSANPTNDFYKGILSGDSPAISAAVANATPGLLDSFTGGNRLASPAAAYGVGRGVANAVAGQMMPAAQGLSGNYTTAANQQTQAASLTPSVMDAYQRSLASAYGAGSAWQQQDQAQINDQIARYNAPFGLLNWYEGATSGQGGGSSSLTSPYFTQPSGGFGQVLSAGLSGAALGNKIFGGLT